jgi:hypothetical protein
LLGPSAGVLLPLVGVVAAVSVLIGVDEPLPLVANATPPPMPMSATTAAPAIKVVFVAFNIVERTPQPEDRPGADPDTAPPCEPWLSTG